MRKKQNRSCCKDILLLMKTGSYFLLMNQRFILSYFFIQGAEQVARCKNKMKIF
jgi:hypothetical protein